MATEYKCAACGQHGPFSGRQLKRAIKGEHARCTKCIVNDVPVPLQSNENNDYNETNEDSAPAQTSKPGRLYFSDGASASDSSTSTSSSSSSTSDSDSSEEETMDVSLAAIKQKVLGRQIQTSYDPEVENVIDISDSTKIDLRRELSCAICHEPFYQPVSLLCGHSFCGECLQWWLAHSQQTAAAFGNCPTCRRELTCDGASLGVNTALRACITAMFGEELTTRIQAERLSKLKATAGENGGAHSHGYKVLSAVGDEGWARCGGASNHLHARRSIVLDAQDQRMHLALALRGDPALGDEENVVDVELCLLTMEEDEACDGFPIVVREEDDDEHLVCNEERFHCCVEARARISDGAGSPPDIPIARRSMGRECTVRFRIELGTPTLQNASAICFRHDGTGAEFEIKLPRSYRRGGHVVSPRDAGEEISQQDARGSVMESEVRRHRAQEGNGRGENLDEFEDDGFVVFDENEEEDYDSDVGENVEDEDDVCCLCKEHGELIVCDGGENLEGCGRSFHIECVKRDVVPPGDWVCETCANAFELDVGIEGYEFPISEEGKDGDDIALKQGRLKRNRANALADDDSDDEEFGASGIGPQTQEADPNESDASLEVLPKQGAGSKATKRRCIEDSDDDE